MLAVQRINNHVVMFVFEIVTSFGNFEASVAPPTGTLHQKCHSVGYEGIMILTFDFDGLKCPSPPEYELARCFQDSVKILSMFRVTSSQNVSVSALSMHVCRVGLGVAACKLSKD